MSKRYSEIERSELSEKVIARVSETTTNLACAEIGVPPSTFRGWMTANDDAADRYARAKLLYIETIAADILTIADKKIPLTMNGGLDNAAVQHARLRIDSRKWLLSKLAPKQYGERLMVAGDDESPLQIVRVERVIIDSTLDDKDNVDTDLDDGNGSDDEG